MIRFPVTIVRVALIGLPVVGLALPRSLPAQSAAAGTGGAARLAQEQRLANNWRRVLMIGAHPDDEDTELLTILSRGDGINTAYLSLTRGDGGQNLIGPELGEALGVLRTEELAAARRIDGAAQFFTRAFDFGFSKTAKESLQLWNHDSVLKDMVRIIRRFKPQVIVSVWSGTPSDGHGHHQASGTLALEAFRASGDARRFAELEREGLRTWQPAKFYRSVFRGLPGTATLTFDGGVIDPATGHSLHQLAVQSRDQHRSQNQGNLEELGPATAAVRLDARIPEITGRDDSLFDGIAPPPARGFDGHMAEQLLIESGVIVDAFTTDDEVTPGQQLTDTLVLWNTGRDTVRVAFNIAEHRGFVSRPGDCVARPYAVPPGVRYRCTFVTTVAARANPTTPYYLNRPRHGALYQWTGDPSLWGEPEEPPLSASVAVEIPGRGSASVSREVAARFRDPVIGEVRRAVMIVPAITVSLEPNARLWPVGIRSREYQVVLEHLARDSSDAVVSLTVPRGWRTGKAQAVHFAREGERATLTFNVIAPLSAPLNVYHIEARAVVGHDTMDTGIYRIRYPHVRARNLLTVAQAKVVVANVTFPAIGAIGYVRGGGDLVPEAMVNAGVPVSLLTGDALERAPLGKWKVIVIGPRAYEADESLKRAHPRLMKWLEAGGTLIIEYQQLPYVAGGFAPKPFTLVSPTQSRVTDETAPVRLLAKAHPVLNWPNRIVNGDFDDWVQERGLDFPSTWDPAWIPMLETHDSGGPPLSGGLLIARVGKGTAVYTGLAFHRQLPAIVPGAWRLWANILGAGGKVVKH